MKALSSFFALALCCSIDLIAQKAPDFSVTTAEGKPLTLYADYLDKGKTVVIELFFVDCPPCNSFAPFFGQLYEEWKSGTGDVEFISLSDKAWDNDENVMGFKQKYNHSWPFVSPDGGSLEAAEIYKNGTYGQYWGTPTTVVIAPDGTVNYNVRDNPYSEWIVTLSAAIAEAVNSNNTGTETPPTALVAGGIRNAKNEAISGVSVFITGDTDTSFMANADGSFAIPLLSENKSYTVTLEKNTLPSNGVTTLDMVLIAKHILAIDTFTQAHQSLVADVNQSGTVTTFDMVVIRQLILGVINEFPAPSWVFMPNTIDITSIAELGALSFQGHKMGDLNLSANPNQLQNAEVRNINGSFNLKIKDHFVKKGEIVNVDFLTANMEAVLAFQFTLNFDIKKLQLVDLEEVNIENFNKNNINFSNKNKGQLSTSWYHLTPQQTNRLFTLQFKVVADGYLSEAIAINSQLTEAVAYSQKETRLGINLLFENSYPLEEEKAILFPNPSVDDKLNIVFSTNQDQPILIKVTDLSGKLISQHPYPVVKGKQQLTIPVSELHAGIYFVQIFQRNKLIEAMKFVKE